jgi:hypothetical protein
LRPFKYARLQIYCNHYSGLTGDLCVCHGMGLQE